MPWPGAYLSTLSQPGQWPWTGIFLPTPAPVKNIVKLQREGCVIQHSPQVSWLGVEIVDVRRASYWRSCGQLKFPFTGSPSFLFKANAVKHFFVLGILSPNTLTTSSVFCQFTKHSLLKMFQWWNIVTPGTSGPWRVIKFWTFEKEKYGMLLFSFFLQFQ